MPFALPRRRRATKTVSAALACLLAFAVLPALPTAVRAQLPEPQVPVIAPGSAYRVQHLVSDSAGLAPVIDPLLVNPWGISFRGTSPFWVANAGTSTSTLYRENSTTPLVKNPGLAAITIPGGLPTGTVGNSTTDFVVTSGMASGAANFLFASITGNISGWNANVPAAGSTTAVIMASHPGHVYLGLAIGNNGSGNFLYAADGANNNIDVFDGNFNLQSEASFPFVDPTLPAGYSTHNIQALGGELYVSYAKFDAMGNYDRPGGAVSVFDFNGNFLRRIHLDGPLSAPWGMALAPASFGIFANALLVGNFDFNGNARISAFNKTSGGFLGQLQDESGTPISIDGLWAITFGNGGNGGDTGTLYFAAGIGFEEHGLFGKINPTTSSATSLVQFADNEFTISEGTGHIDITVTRLGDASNPATVNYATFDASQPGRANQKSDYELAAGKLSFAAGETSKTFRVLFVEDSFVEGAETLELVLSNPTGAGVGLGSPNVAVLTINDNDAVITPGNPIDHSFFFVRMHYLDFLNREPDEAGLNFWAGNINLCPPGPCRDERRVNTSAAFFFAIEFQETGLLDILTHQAAFGRRPLYAEFMPGTQALQRGVVIGTPGAAEQLEANKAAFFNDFVTKPEFVARYPSTLTNEQYVDNLLATAGLSPSQVRLFVTQLTNAQENPPANVAGRPASFGTARLHFNNAQTAATLTATVFNIDFTGAQTPGTTQDNLTNAHIHASATVTPATNGPVVWGFIGTPFNDNNPNDAVVTPFSGGVGGEFRGKWDAPEGNSTTLAAQLSNLREGRAYVNFHTVNFPGGEIRGNLPAADAFRNSLIAGLNSMTLTRAQVLRRVAEQEELKLREFNAAFVTMQYFGYLRRDPDTAGFNFWLGKLNSFNGDFRAAELVRAFIESLEYRQRFGP
jgi:uncharacterized protein (TIGR03118 family)